MKLTITRLIVVACSILSPAVATADSSLWRMTFDTSWLGPAVFHVRIEETEAGVRGTSLSGAVAVLGELPGDHGIDSDLMVFQASRQQDGSFLGTFTAPWQEGELKLTINDDQIEGSVEGGAFNGGISGQKVARSAPIRDYRAILDRFDEVMAAKVFSPSDLDTPGYLAFRETIGRAADVATDDLDILFGFQWGWKNDPFSHFSFKRSHQTAEQMFVSFDDYRVGFDAATIEFDDDIAILKVRTMMGADTIEQIEAAFDRIAEEDPRALIIDLRGNSGGAFAVKPLVEHVIDEPVDAGFFLSQVWNRQYDRLPEKSEVLAWPTWHGWSIVSFWKSVQKSEIVRVQFSPAEPNFNGPVYVLLDKAAASATELAADAFRASGITTSIGERTAGEMLSQSMFDVAEGFIVTLPVADYYSLVHGRIEGAGVPVDIETDPADALGVAMKLLHESVE